MHDAITATLAAAAKEVRSRKIPVSRVFRSGGKTLAVSFKPGKMLVVPDAFDQLPTHTLIAKGRSKPSRKHTAILFSGGPASGGHNVLAGVRALIPELYGVRAGPGGLLRGDLFPLKSVDAFMNTGGFDALGTDRTKIITPEQIARARTVLHEHKISALIIVGGDDSNTNTALLAQEFAGDIQVIGVPKTMDGDLSFGALLPVPFGFDTATKIYAEMVGNICRDAISSGKYWHFIRLMGRNASHVTLEVALRTRPTITLISEEVEHTKLSLHAIIDHIAKVILTRRHNGLHHGVVLIPEGLLEAIPQVRALLHEVDLLMVAHHAAIRRKSLVKRVAFLARKRGSANAQLFTSLPASIQQMMTLDRDAHGNLNVSQIPTEHLLSQLILQRIPDLACNTHFFGYEGRCGVPSAFDAMLGYNLGLTAASLVLDGKTGVVAGLGDLSTGAKPYGIPLRPLLSQEVRLGKPVWVIAKTRVGMNDPAFRYFVGQRERWEMEDPKEFPSPRQFSDATMPLTVTLNQGYRDARFKT